MEPTSSVFRFDSSRYITDLATQLASVLDQQACDLYAGTIRATFTQPTSFGCAKHLQLELARLQRKQAITDSTAHQIMTTLVERLFVGIGTPLQEVAPLYIALRDLVDSLTLLAPKTWPQQLHNAINNDQYTEAVRLERLYHVCLRLCYTKGLPNNTIELAKAATKRLSVVHKRNLSCEAATYALTPAVPSMLLPVEGAVPSTSENNYGKQPSKPARMPDGQTDIPSTRKPIVPDFTFEVPLQERYNPTDR